MESKIIFRPSKVSKKRIITAIIGGILLIGIFVYKFLC